LLLVRKTLIQLAYHLASPRLVSWSGQNLSEEGEKLSEEGQKH
jgi:hypothetical protein